MKKRLDVLLYERGHAPSRERAKTLIMEGKVYVNAQKEDKPGNPFEEDCALEVRGDDLPFVSRGGLKLAKALEVFPIDLSGKTCLDIGASTGGFTDCMLQNGAARVYAVDVGYGQLAWKLRTDDRVACLEKTNFRYMTPDDFPNGERIAFAGADVSFISLTKILPPAYAILSEDGEMVALVKPQFEAGRQAVGKKGVVRDAAVHREVLFRITDFAKETGFLVRGLSFSPVLGPEGNREYLLFLRKRGEALPDMEERIGAVVEESHRAL